MFLRLLIESFTRQKRRKLLAGIAILLGTTAVTAMLALATSIGDRIHRELAVYGANIIVTPKASNLEVKVGGVNIQPATGNAYLKESDLEKLKTIFWANNITGVSPEFDWPDGGLVRIEGTQDPQPVQAVSFWFDHKFNGTATGAEQLHPWWRVQGEYPRQTASNAGTPVLLGAKLASRLRRGVGDFVGYIPSSSNETVHQNHGLPLLHVVGILHTNDSTEEKLVLPLGLLSIHSGAISRVEISARTRPEDAFARQNPDTLSPAQRDLWYCRPYANSIAYQIREAIPNADATQVRRVEQTEGTLLSRISGLMWLVSAAALFAAGFAVSAAMATAVMERRAEIGLMRSLGASRGSIAALFYAESSLLALAGGILGYFAGSLLAWWLGSRIFPADGASPILNFVLLPVVVAMAIVVAILGSTPAIRSGLRAEVANILRGDQ